MSIVFEIVVVVIIFGGLGIYAAYMIRNTNTKIRVDYYKILLCLYGISATEFVFKDKFNMKIQLIIFFIQIIVICFLLIFLLKGDISLKANDLKVHFLLIVPVLVIDIYQLLKFIAEMEYWDMNVEIVVLLGELIGIMAIFLSGLKKSNEVRRKDEAYLRNSSFFSYKTINKMRYSEKEKEAIDVLVMKLYRYGKEARLSPSLVKTIAREMKVSANVRNDIYERLFETGLNTKISKMSFPEFAAVLFPEVYEEGRTSFSATFESRTYEAVFNEMRKLIAKEQRERDALNKKIDALLEKISWDDFIEESLHEDEIRKTDTPVIANQTLIRELFHTIFTPLSTIKLECQWMIDESKNLEDIQISKIENVFRNVELIRAVLTAYRELTMLVPATGEKTDISSDLYVITLLDALKAQYSKDLFWKIDKIPVMMGNYSVNIITILILPLIQNAYEAAPEMTTILLRYIEADEKHIIEIENQCILTPKREDLSKDGYSSKKKHVGEGLRSVRRIAESMGIAFEIKSYSNKKKVIAKLVFAKSN